MTEIATFTLPGGMLDASGQRHRDGCLRPLSGADEDWLCSLAPSTRRAGILSELLMRCVTNIGPYQITLDAIRDLCIGDRDYLLVKLREATFGPKMSRVLACAHAGCGARMDLDLSVDDFAVDERPTQPSHRLRLADPPGGATLDIEFRAPRVRELERIAALAAVPEDELRDRLLEGCIVRVTAFEGGGQSSLSGLSPASKRALAAAIEDAGPRVELELELVCPECSRTFDVEFDPGSLLIEDVAAGRAVFERELHQLAFHYHWSLRELLELTRPRRQRFLRLLGEELGSARGRS
jgi:hypothetical protein